LPSSPPTTSPTPTSTTQAPTSMDGGDCTSGVDNTKDIDPSIPVPTHLTASLHGYQTAMTVEIELDFRPPPGYLDRQVYLTTPPGPFATASACAAAGSPGVAFLTVDRGATYRFYVVAQGNGLSQKYSSPASVILTVP
jgi:hypothetical protein